MITSRRFLTEYTMALTIVLRPGITATKHNNVVKSQFESLVGMFRTGLERPEHPECAQGGEASQVHRDGYVGHSYHREVEPVPGVAEVGETLQREPAAQQLHRGLVGVDRREDHLRAGRVPGTHHSAVSWPHQGSGLYTRGRGGAGRSRN